MERLFFRCFSCFIFVIIACLVFIQQRKNTSDHTKAELDAALENSMRRTLKHALFGGIICTSFISIVLGITFITLYREDGAFVFKNKTIDLNEAVKNGNIPEAGTYVKVSFGLVGKEFVSESGDTIFHPIILQDTGVTPYVFGLGESPTGSNVIKELHYVEESASYIGKGLDEGELPTIVYTGRLMIIRANLDSYNAALSDSSITNSNYIIENLYINTDIQKDQLRKNLVFLLVFFFIALFIDAGIIIATILFKDKF